VLQSYIHYYSFPGDKLSIKILIYTLLLIESAQVCCAAADVYYWFGAGYGNVIQFNNLHLSPFDTALLGSITAFIVQLFFCYRIWKLRKTDLYIVICVVIVGISALQLAGGIVGSVTAHSQELWSALPGDTTTSLFIYLWLIGETVANFLIAITMTRLLLTSKTENPKQSNGPANQAATLIVQSNSVTAIIALIATVLYATSSGANYYLTLTLMLGKIYSNTLLATLNRRIFLKRPPNDSRPSYTDVSGGTSSSGMRFTSGVPEITITTVTETSSYRRPFPNTTA